MSLSAPRATGPRNPAKRFIEYKAGDEQGFFHYYDKNIEDAKQRNVVVDLSNRIVLDKDLFNITGYDGGLEANIISNEVRSVDDILIVKRWKAGKGEIIFRGSYTQLKESKPKEFNYTRCIYLYNPEEDCIEHLKLSGVAFSAWINEVENNSKFQASYISHTGGTPGKKGNVKFIKPVFEVGEAYDEETLEKAMEADREVQNYLNAYLKANGSSTKVPTGESPDHHEEEEVDTKQWREVVAPGGEKLGELSIRELRELHEKLVEEGAKGALIDCVGQGIYDFQQAAKRWDQQADSKGKALTDYTIEDLKKVLPKVPYNNPSRQMLEAALEAKEAQLSSPPDDYQEDDDVPF